MEIAFLIILVLVSQLLHMLAVHQSMGVLPHPMGVSLLSLISQAVLLVMCIWYLGWLWGILIFVGQIFSLIHSTVGWVLTIQSLYYQRPEQFYNLVKWEENLMTPALILPLIFCVISFWVTEFKSCYFWLSQNNTIWISLLIGCGILGVARLFVSKHFN